MTEQQTPLTAAELRAAFAAASVQPVPVDLPGIGRVFVKPLTVADVQTMPQPAPELADQINAMGTARGVAMVLSDATGNRIFDPNSLDDLQLISQQGWDRMSALIKAAGDAAGAQKNG